MLFNGCIIFPNMGINFPVGSADKESACNGRDMGSIPGLGRSRGEGKGYPLQYSGLYSPWGSLGQGTGVGSRSLLQDIFPTQGSNPGLSHCRWILNQLSHIV